MELKEVYEKIGGDYDDVVRRLMGEKLVRKFLLKFLDDKSYADLERTLSEGDYKEAFRAADSYFISPLRFLCISFATAVESTRASVLG